jgi:hypothetical protein
MKNKNINILLVLLTMFSGLASCNLSETNVNPNDPTDVPLETLLPPTIHHTNRLHGGNAAVISGIFSKYFIGLESQAIPIQRYLIDEALLMNPIWQDFYNLPLHTCKIIMEKAENQESPHYAGVAKVLLALNLGTVTSLWGNVPFQQAGNASEFPHPAYDGQESLYAAIQSLLDEAILDLSEPFSVFAPGSDDVIFQGDLYKWMRVAHTLKARYYMHTIKRNPNAAYLALEALEGGLTSASDNLAFPHTSSERNPWFTYFQNTGYIQINPFFRDLLEGDSKEDFLIRRSFGQYRMGDFFGAEAARFNLVTYAEHLTLKAEAAVRAGLPEAQQYLKDAITHHHLWVSDGSIELAVIETYLDNLPQLSGNIEADVPVVMQEKYVIMYPSIEGFTDFRRSGFPLLIPNPEADHAQNPGGEIPRRLPYPQNERLYNQSFPASNPNLQDRFWWDL